MPRSRPDLLDVRLGTHPERNTDDIARFYAKHLRCEELHASPQVTFSGFATTSDQKLCLATYYEGFHTWKEPVSPPSAQAHSNLKAYSVILHGSSEKLTYPYSMCSLDGEERLAFATRTEANVCEFMEGSEWPHYGNDRFSSQWSLDDLMNGDPDVPTHFHLRPRRQIRTRLDDVSQIWDIASAPSQDDGSSTVRYALASTHGLHVYDWWVEPDDWPDDFMTSQMNSPSGQRVVTFKDHNIIMSGQCDGLVNFTDCRLPEQSSSAPRLRHCGGAVTGIVSTKNDSVIIVSGFDGTAAYDLRCVQAPQQQSDHSAPLLRFQTSPELTSDHYMSGKRLAYSAALDICVVASCGQSAMPHDRVALYQASTGRKLDAKIDSHDHTTNGRVQGIGIAQVRDGPESIIVLQDRAVQEWNVMNGGDSGDDDET